MMNPTDVETLTAAADVLETEARRLMGGINPAVSDLADIVSVCAGADEILAAAMTLRLIAADEGHEPPEIY